MTKPMEVLPRAHLDVSGILANISLHASSRASSAEIIACRLNIGLTDMELNGDTLYIYGAALTRVEAKAEEKGLKTRDYILEELSA